MEEPDRMRRYRQVHVQRDQPEDYIDDSVHTAQSRVQTHGRATQNVVQEKVSRKGK